MSIHRYDVTIPRAAPAVKPWVMSDSVLQYTLPGQALRRTTATSIKPAEASEPDLSDLSVFYNILKLLCHNVDIQGWKQLCRGLFYSISPSSFSCTY